MNRRNQLYHLLLATIASVLISGETRAFSYACPGDRDPAPLALARYDAVFVGEAVATRLLGGASSPGQGIGNISTEFVVREVYKGEIAETAVVTDRTPLQNFRLGTTYLVWATREKGNLVTSDCARNSRSNTAGFERDVELLEHPERTPRTACAQLDDEGTRAMRKYIDVEFLANANHAPSAPVFAWADAALASQREVAGACLRRIVEQGLGGTGLWDQRSPPPDNGEFALEVLSRVDPASAVRFWRARRDKVPLGYPWDRIEFDLRLLEVGDRFAIPSVIRFLNDNSQTANHEVWFASIAGRAFREFARLRYEPAIPLLEQFRERGIVPEILAEVYAAWLREDRTRLVELAADPRFADAANDALRHLDARTPLHSQGTERN